MEQDEKSIDNWKQERTDRDAVGGGVLLWLVHLESGRYLDEHGAYTEGAKHYEIEDAEEAVRRKDKLLEQFPFACVHIGHPDNSESFNSPRVGDFTKEKRRWLSWKSLGYIKRKLRPEPTLTVFDPAKDPSVSG